MKAFNTHSTASSFFNNVKHVQRTRYSPKNTNASCTQRIHYKLTCLRDFLIMGCGLSSSSENGRVRGSKSRLDDANDIAVCEIKSVSFNVTQNTNIGDVCIEVLNLIYLIVSRAKDIHFS